MLKFKKPPSDDYLKYWRVIRYYVKAKYKISTPDLEMLLFLRSEQFFSRDDFNSFEELMSWDKHRFERLRKEGWIEMWRKGMKRKKALYQLSFKTERVLSSIYKKLSGEEIPASSQSNPMFAKNVSYSHKVYRNMIKEMNAAIKQQRHHSNL